MLYKNHKFRLLPAECFCNWLNVGKEEIVSGVLNPISWESGWDVVSEPRSTVVLDALSMIHFRSHERFDWHEIRHPKVLVNTRLLTVHINSLTMIRTS